MDNESYCNELSKLYVELSKPLEPRFAFRYDEYTVPFTNQLRIQNYLHVIKELHKNCQNNKEKNNQIFNEISSNTKSYYNNIKMILDKNIT